MRLYPGAVRGKAGCERFYLAEPERGRTGISVKMLIRVCDLLGLSADDVLFGEERHSDTQLPDKIHRIDNRYIPLLNKMITELLALSKEEQSPVV